MLKCLLTALAIVCCQGCFADEVHDEIFSYVMISDELLTNKTERIGAQGKSYRVFLGDSQFKSGNENSIKLAKEAARLKVEALEREFNDSHVGELIEYERYVLGDWFSGNTMYYAVAYPIAAN
jgi:hypothetical protein